MTGLVCIGNDTEHNHLHLDPKTECVMKKQNHLILFTMPYYCVTAVHLNKDPEYYAMLFAEEFFVTHSNKRNKVLYT